MPPQSPKPYKSATSKTIPRTFRISHTHNNILDQPSVANPSALVRVLLTLYFNKKIPGNLEALIEKEIEQAELSKRESTERLTRNAKEYNALSLQARRG